MNEISFIELKCPKCNKLNKVKFLHGFSCSYRDKGSTGISHMVTKSKSNKLIGYCECGYKFKKSDLDE